MNDKGKNTNQKRQLANEEKKENIELFKQALLEGLSRKFDKIIREGEDKELYPQEDMHRE